MAKANDIPQWIKNRILGFFNHARNVGMILDGSILDDPADGPGTTMGRTLAARILRERNLLPRRRFTDFDQLDAIRGVGPGTLDDLVYSFGNSADESFRAAMYKGVIYPENWPLEYFRTEIEDQKAFTELANDPDKLRAFLLENIEAVCKARNVSKQDTGYMLGQLKNAYLDKYSNSTQVAGLALALWFYEFDADNWFSWETISKTCQGYFDHNMNSYPWFMDLYMVKGFRQRGIVSAGITPEDLPVVVNWAEQTITFWISTLYD